MNMSGSVHYNWLVANCSGDSYLPVKIIVYNGYISIYQYIFPLNPINPKCLVSTLSPHSVLCYRFNVNNEYINCIVIDELLG